MKQNEQQTEKMGSSKNPKSNPSPFRIHIVSSHHPSSLTLLKSTLLNSSIVALDAEWKPVRTRHATQPDAPESIRSFPTVALLQIACRLSGSDLIRDVVESPVFILDLMSMPLSDVYEILRDVFVSDNVLKLGFRFKQDLVYLNSTFESLGGFDRVEPFVDINSMYHHIKFRKAGKKFPKENRSLATICEEILNISLSKELQCSDWSCRPLTKEQISYAAADAYYLLEIYSVFVSSFLAEGTNTYSITGLKEILVESNICNNVLFGKFCKASEMVKSCDSNLYIQTMTAPKSWSLHEHKSPLDKQISIIIERYGERIILKEADKKPRASKRKERKQSITANSKEQLESNGIWQGLPPWDPSVGGDGCPKFLCDVMVEGLARYLRCVGVDAAIPSTKKPEPRQLFDQAYKEKRVILTRDAKLMKHQYLISNQVYKVMSFLKNDQLIEVIETFHLKISEDQLMSRCTKCNGRFIQKPLSMEEAIEASNGFQVIPNCLFNRNIEFWQCTDCHQLYWEGTQYQNAVEKFVTICKLNDDTVSS